MKRIRIIFTTALTSALLASCGIYQKYERPAEAVAGMDSLYGPGLSTTDTASIASLPWTELFTDPMLQSLIHEGLQSNTDLGIARLRVKEAEASYLEVLTARQALLQAELTEANDRFDRIQGVINLYHALGGGAD